MVLIDKRLTTELIEEGLARDVVRFVQNLRKDAGLNIEDRIGLSVVTEVEALQSAVQHFAEHIRSETLADELTYEPMTGDDGHTTEAKLAGGMVTLGLRRLGG